MRGNPLTLLGDELKVGDVAPDFVVLANDLKPVQFVVFSWQNMCDFVCAITGYARVPCFHRKVQPGSEPS